MPHMIIFHRANLFTLRLMFQMEKKSSLCMHSLFNSRLCRGSTVDKTLHRLLCRIASFSLRTALNHLDIIFLWLDVIMKLTFCHHVIMTIRTHIQTVSTPCNSKLYFKCFLRLLTISESSSIPQVRSEKSKPNLVVLSVTLSFRQWYTTVFFCHRRLRQIGLIACPRWSVIKCMMNAKLKMIGRHKPGSPYWRGRLSTVGIFVLTSLDWVMATFDIANIIYFFYKTTALSLHRQFPAQTVQLICPPL
jgi:hypothetical protein